MNKNVFYLVIFGLILYLFLRKKQQTADVKAAQAVAQKSIQLGTTTSANGQTTVTGGGSITTPTTTTGGSTTIPFNPNTPTTQPVFVTEENINYVKFYENLTA